MKIIFSIIFCLLLSCYVHAHDCPMHCSDITTQAALDTSLFTLQMMQQIALSSQPPARRSSSTEEMSARVRTQLTLAEAERRLRVIRSPKASCQTGDVHIVMPHVPQAEHDMLAAERPGPAPVLTNEHPVPSGIQRVQPAAVQLFYDLHVTPSEAEVDVNHNDIFDAFETYECGIQEKRKRVLELLNSPTTRSRTVSIIKSSGLEKLKKKNIDRQLCNVVSVALECSTTGLGTTAGGIILLKFNDLTNPWGIALTTIGSVCIVGAGCLWKWVHIVHQKRRFYQEVKKLLQDRP